MEINIDRRTAATLADIRSAEWYLLLLYIEFRIRLAVHQKEFKTEISTNDIPFQLDYLSWNSLKGSLEVMDFTYKFTKDTSRDPDKYGDMVGVITISWENEKKG